MGGGKGRCSENSTIGLLSGKLEREGRGQGG